MKSKEFPGRTVAGHGASRQRPKPMPEQQVRREIDAELAEEDEPFRPPPPLTGDDAHPLRTISERGGEMVDIDMGLSVPAMNAARRTHMLYEMESAAMAVAAQALRVARQIREGTYTTFHD